VADNHRGGGHGKALVSHAEAWASQHGVEALYLLTTTAAEFFARLGYVAIPRSEAPAAIAATAQFASLCPSSSTFMRKVLAAESPPHAQRR
jgi:amino-acid N-acetyltransferase